MYVKNIPESHNKWIAEGHAHEHPNNNIISAQLIFLFNTYDYRYLF